MPSSNYTATSFLGGEWSPSAQGRFDDPRYRTALNVCFNSLPIEAGAWQRRSGTQNLGPSYKGSPGCLRSFRLGDGRDMLCEITYTSGETSSHIRFWSLPYTGPKFNSTTASPETYTLIPDETANILAVSSDNPAILEIDADRTWATGEIAVLYFAPCQCGQLNFRQVILTRLTATTYSLADAYTGTNINGAQVDGFTGAGTNIAAHVLTIDAPYTSAWDFDLIRMAQSGYYAYFVGGDNVVPYVLSVTHLPNAASATPVIAFEAATFVDGPYELALTGSSQTGNDPGTLSATGTTTPTLTSGVYTFVDADVGRQIRLWSQPPAYVSVNTYASGDVVTYQGGWWTANNVVPAGTFPNGVEADGAGKLYWILTPQAGLWVYGTITSVAAGVATLAINAAVPAANGTTVDIWQLGIFRSTHYPTVVRFVQGRVWFGGAAQSRVDSSMSGGAVAATITMSPTDQFGNVNDDNGIEASFDTGAPFDIVWLLDDRAGMLVGTLSGEYALQASALSDPLTPTSIQISKVSAYGSAAVEPLRVGLADVFVQLSRKKLFEYLLDYFSQKFAGRHINEYAKNLTASSIQEIVYTEEKVPVIWARTGDGDFIGCTYRRDSGLLTQPPNFFGWHRHALGSSRVVTSICHATPATRNAELIDGVAMLTEDVNHRYTVEVLRPQFDDADTIEYGWYLDTAVIPSGTDVPDVIPGPPPPVIIAGPYYFELTIIASSHGVNTFMDGSIRIGIATASADLADLGGVGTDLYFLGQTFWIENGAVSNDVGITWTNGNVIGIALDSVNQLIWFKNITTASNWNGNAANDPATGVGGLSFAGLGLSACWFFVTGIHYGGDDKVSLNTGATSFVGTIPAGFSALDVSGTFAFNFNDTTPGASLSGGNLIMDTGGNVNFYGTLNAGGVPFVWDSTYTYHVGDYVTAGGAVFRAIDFLGFPNLNRTPLALGGTSNFWGPPWVYQGARANAGIPKS